VGDPDRQTHTYAGERVNLRRRTFIVAGGATLVGSIALSRSAGTDVAAHFDQVEKELGGRVGVAAVDTGNGARLLHRAQERFAMCSTFKWMLAAALLARVDKQEITLERRLSYGPKDLLDFSPVTEAHVGEGALSIKSLCEAAVEASDNTAANTLLKFIGGPGSLTRYLRQIGDSITRLDRFEPDLNTNLSGDPRDTTAPETMIATMRTILMEKVLSAGSRESLLDWMKNCQTGLHRLRAGLLHTWTVGDKTGTGANGAANDNAIAWPPGRSPVLIAAYLSDSHAPSDALDAAHARIASIIAAAFA
jgi:beta-lactamase class A